ncbi:MAG: alpha/beta hydrolase [Pseudonocardia sp.]
MARPVPAHDLGGDRHLPRRIRTTGRLPDDLPTLWVHGGDDQLVPIDGTQEGIERLRGGRFEERILPGARHEVFNETNQDEVLAGVTTFVDRSLAERSHG